MRRALILRDERWRVDLLEGHMYTGATGMVFGVCVLMQRMVLELILVTGLPDGRRTARLYMEDGLDGCLVTHVSLTERDGLVLRSCARDVRRCIVQLWRAMRVATIVCAERRAQ
jgi:hypothetical protein